MLVVGGGNSGAEIALELSRGRRTWISGDAGAAEVPFRIEGRLARFLLIRLLFRVVFHRLLTVKTPFGRRARPRMLHRSTPLIRVKSADLVAAGIARVPRVIGARNGAPLLLGDQALDVANVIWCTGYRPGFSWIDLPIFDEKGDPAHQAGVVPGSPGIYFVGLNFLFAMSSAMIHGVGRDAARIAKAVARQQRSPRRAVPAATSPRLAASGDHLLRAGAGPG